MRLQYLVFIYVVKKTSLAPSDSHLRFAKDAECAKQMGKLVLSDKEVSHTS